MKHTETWDGRHYGRILSFFYHIEKCNDLKKSYEEKYDFKYDIVIRLRGDLSFVSPFDITNIINDENINNTIYDSTLN